MKDELLLFCEEQQTQDYAELVNGFGFPKETAAELFSEMDAVMISRFARSRLKVMYLLAALVIVASLGAMTVSALDYSETQQLAANAETAQHFVHPDGTECISFRVKTNFRGQDMYWEYSSCIGGIFLTIPSEETDELEPYATDIYLLENGVLEHWTFTQQHKAWIRVYDVKQEVIYQHEKSDRILSERDKLLAHLSPAH